MVNFGEADDEIKEATVVIAQSLKTINKLNFEMAIKNKVNNYKTSINSFRPLISKLEHVAMI